MLEALVFLGIGMYDNDIKISILEFYDLIEYTLSFKFREDWKHLYSERLVKLFQLKILQAMKNQKPIKKTSLINYLTNKGRYKKEIIIDFFDSIDIEIYSPFIS
jgi:hypothetical protein